MTKNFFLFLFLGFLGIIAIPLSMVPAQIMNYLTDVLTSPSQNEIGDLDLSMIIPYIMLFFLTSVGLACISIWRRLLSGVYLENSVKERSLALYNKFLRTSPAFFHNNEPTRISNTSVIETRIIEKFYLSLRLQLPATLIGLACFSYVLFYGLDTQTYLIGQYLPVGFSQTGNWFLASFILLLSPLHAFFLFFDKKLQSGVAASGEETEHLLNRSVENLNNIREIRNHFAFDYIIDRMRQNFNQKKKFEISITRINALFEGLPSLVNGLTKAILLSIGATLCVSEIELPIIGIQVAKIEWKDYMGFAGMAVVVYAYIGELTGYLMEWRMSRESIRRVQQAEKLPEVFSNKKNHEVSLLSGTDSIKYNGVNFTAADGHKILNNINIDIPHGSKIAFVGPSGAGKTTTMNLLVRENLSFPGTVNFGEKNVIESNFLSLSRDVGMVQQKSSIFDLSLRDNALLSLRRPSPIQIDDNGPVDISHFEDCKTLKDLDQKIIEAFIAVNLDEDMVLTALETKLCKRGFDDSEVRSSLRQLRNNCMDSDSVEKDLISSFDSREFMDDMSIVDNLLFGLFKDESNGKSGLSSQKTLIIKYLRKQPIFEDLVQIGYKLFLADHQIAQDLQIQSKALHKTLRSYSHFKGRAFNLNRDLKLLLRTHRSILADIALESTISKIRNYIDKEIFIKKILQCRKAVLTSDLPQELHLTLFSSEEIIGFIPLKEYLIGGKLNSKRADARNKVASFIKQEYLKIGLKPMLILLGMESPAGINGSNLSEGMIMKVIIARVLLKKPKVLLLDEATASLDETSQAHIVGMISEAYENKTILSISHRLSTIRHFDKILVFNHGEIIQQGTYDELANEQGLFQELVKKESSSEYRGEIYDTPGSGIAKTIAQSELFRGLESSEIALLDRVSKIQICPQGEILFERGDVGTEYYFIMKGRALFFTREDGEMNIVNEYGPGKSFGELALFGKGKRIVSVKAKTELQLCVITKADFEKILEACPKITMKLLLQVSNLVADLRDKLST